MPQTLTGSSPICDRARVSKNRRHGYFQLRDTCLRSYMPRVRSMTVWPIRLPSCHCRSTKRGLQRSAYECRRWQIASAHPVIRTLVCRARRTCHYVNAVLSELFLVVQYVVDVMVVRIERLSLAVPRSSRPMLVSYGSTNVV